MSHKEDYIEKTNRIYSLIENQADDISRLQVSLKEIRKIVDFLCEYNKDDIVVCPELRQFIAIYTAKYIFNNNLRVADFPKFTISPPKLISDGETTAIFEERSYGVSTYFILDKPNAVIVKVDSLNPLIVAEEPVKTDTKKTKSINLKKENSDESK